ncbi:MAG: ATP synthase subunit I [Betaproteobacteria bacterium]|nr:ATP synthase subunit I [Betaproteobacteria bacterium]
MFRAIYLQIGAVVLAAALAGIFAGIEGGVSAALGGGACVLPNFLFALRLNLLAHRARPEQGVSAVSASSWPVNFFIGEFIKIAATIALLVAAVKTYPGLHWPGFLAGLVLSLQAAFIAFWKKP